MRVQKFILITTIFSSAKTSVFDLSCKQFQFDFQGSGAAASQKTQCIFIFECGFYCIDNPLTWLVVVIDILSFIFSF